ncbi:hypothetical protein V5799_018231 [Amblyomma americanum]|uniref:Uncharacterized protein n=1 Tax=Amblyomma americanum TaxID=6943 RepID=A0AAQ4F0Z0_AMBAM
MEAVEDVLSDAFPDIDEDLFDYLEGVLDGGKEDFSTCDEVYDAVGEMLLEIAGDTKDENEIREICARLLHVMKGETDTQNGGMHSAPAKVLNAPVQLKALAAEFETSTDEVQSIWMKQRDNSLDWPTTLLVVSHDRLFLDTVPTDILHFHSHQIVPYRGNYDNFVKVMTERVKNQQREYEAQQQYKAHVQVFIDRFRFNAKRASLVQSKLKMLEKL